MNRGVDPAAQAQQKKADALTEPTISDLAEAYIERWAKPRKKSWGEDQRLLEKNVIPKWKRRKAKDITKRDVVAMLEAAQDRGLTTGANRILAVTEL
uniref:Integrase family protein n=1 Tax=Magnetococcus massalia (strain MO-1) TaxID=451514 RepID=A0A1S7LML4_MAGMO